MIEIDTDQLLQGYKGFFKGSEAGKYYVEQLTELRERYLTDAMVNFSVETLARASGVQAALDLINNVIDGEITPQD